jgi:hypothetical protein
MYKVFAPEYEAKSIVARFVFRDNTQKNFIVFSLKSNIKIILAQFRLTTESI